MTTTTAQDKLDFLRRELGLFVGPHELRKETQKGSTPVILDVRKPERFAQGHLPGAINIPRAELPDRLTEVPKDGSLVLYCSDITCFASKKAAVTLLDNGYEDVRVLYGGFEAWRDHGHDVEKDAETAATPSAN